MSSEELESWIVRAAEGAEPPAWFFEWRGASCGCCQHLRSTEDWQRCKGGCIQAKFPLHLRAEWELFLNVIEEVPIVFAAAGGAMTHLQHRINIGTFLNWARDIERLPRRRWKPLAYVMRQLLGEWEKAQKLRGAFTLEDKEWALLESGGEPADADGERSVQADSGS